jgi:hypothetical protein
MPCRESKRVRQRQRQARYEARQRAGEDEDGVSPPHVYIACNFGSYAYRSHGTLIAVKAMRVETLSWYGCEKVRVPPL